jgi:hypothetical protein
MRIRPALKALIPIALTVAVAAHAARSGKEEDWDTQLRRLLWQYTSQKTRIFLHGNLPGFFPLPFLCRLTEGDERKTVLPGDTVNVGPAEAELHCQNGLGGALAAGTSLRVEQDGTEPSLFLIQGSLNIGIGSKAMLLQSQGFFLRATGEAPETRIFAFQNADGYGIACGWGRLKGNFIPSGFGDPRKQFLLSRSCLMELESGKSKDKIYLFDHDVVHPSDREIPRRLWPSHDFEEVAKSLTFPQIIPGHVSAAYVGTNASPSDHLKLQWTVSQHPIECVILTQSKETDHPKESHRFQANNHIGQLLLQRDFRKFWLSISCSDEKRYLISSILSPQAEFR